MSVQAMLWARGRASTPAAQLVLFGLADAADASGITYLGQATLAARCSCGERTVRENLARLERDGLIARRRRNNTQGHRTSDYAVLAPLAGDRGSMLDADDEELRYPPEIAALACTSDPDNPFALPADHAARDYGLPASPAGSDQVLPADDAEPTGGSLHPYRRITPSLPAGSAREQLEEHQSEPKEELTAAEATDDDPDAERMRDFQAWRARHPSITNITTAWDRYTTDQPPAANSVVDVRAAGHTNGAAS